MNHKTILENPMNAQEKIEDKNRINHEEINEAETFCRLLSKCPFCNGNIIRRGLRKKKYETVQRYYCVKCNKSFISAITKNKTYPLKIIIDSVTLYNRLTPLEQIPDIIKERYGISITSRIISHWLKEYGQYLPFLRMREFASKKYDKKEFIEETKLFHKQIYNFKYHRAKLDLILNEEFRHYRFRPLQEFLELAIAECPHQIFQNSTKRASDYKNIFNLDQVKIVKKENTAVKVANFITQVISNNKLRHEILQEFMIANDSVSIAAETAVLINSEDIMHLKHELNFEIPITLEDGEYITGHIDLIQIRNGSIYLLDYKPSASKEKPIEQLTLYALALSRLTGIRLYHMRCAWFDDKNYYEFFPLHVVYKLKKRGKNIKAIKLESIKN